MCLPFLINMHEGVSIWGEVGLREGKEIERSGGRQQVFRIKGQREREEGLFIH